MPGYTARRTRTPSSRRAQPARRPAPPARSELDVALDAAAARAAADPGTATTFAALGLPPRLVAALTDRGIVAPFAIQTSAVPDALAGRDVLGRAQTGSGKTLAFGLPMLARLAGGTRSQQRPRGLVLVPTRELAQQVHDALQPLAQRLGLVLLPVYGGAPMGRQITALRRGVDVVIATPGRLQDLCDQGACVLADVEFTTVDEADHMSDLGFLPAVRKLLDLTRTGGQRLLFSATLDGGVGTLVREYLVDPALHAIAADTRALDAMDHRVFTVTADAKLGVAAEIGMRPGRTLFFVRTKHGADRLATQLRRTGVDAGAIHGNLTQNARRKALDAFTRGEARVLVATDVAARGIHVDDVDLVVHFDPPADHKDYLHRSGRTARAGATGTVLSLQLPDQVRESERVRERAGVTALPVIVSAGHPAVRELASSGTPIVVRPAPEHRFSQGSTGAPSSRRRAVAGRSSSPGRGRSDRRSA